MKGETTIVGGVTIAEGIAVENVGRLPLSIVRDVVRDVLLVSEPAIEGAIAYLLEDEKLVAEGAGRRRRGRAFAATSNAFTANASARCCAAATSISACWHR